MRPPRGPKIPFHWTKEDEERLIKRRVERAQFEAQMIERANRPRSKQKRLAATIRGEIQKRRKLPVSLAPIKGLKDA